MTPQVDILLVDDHEENLLALEAILVDPAYNLVRASSGRAALKEVLRRDFALILLDVAMPDLDGYETAAEAYGPALLGVLLTGASADGAEGLATVKARGGKAIVEDPSTAECRTMPAAGLAATAVDYVLPLAKIGDHLVTLAEGTRA